MITAKVLTDSIAPMGQRITTIEYVAPRSILAEINTHRVFSRSAASSRAIPIAKMIEKVESSPFVPIWNRNKPGMQGIFDFSPDEEKALTECWLEGAREAVARATKLMNLKAHKQQVNRVLEPYSFVKGVITSTTWDNFYKLRTKVETTQPEFVVLANCMQNAMNLSQPDRLEYGEWHLPYVTEAEKGSLEIDNQKWVSAARCARVSYKAFNEDKFSEVEKDLELCDSLYQEEHMSPFEHQATPLYPLDEPMSLYQGNFNGFVQQRKLIEAGMQ